MSEIPPVFKIILHRQITIGASYILSITKNVIYVKFFQHLQLNLASAKFSQKLTNTSFRFNCVSQMEFRAPRDDSQSPASRPDRWSNYA